MYGMDRSLPWSGNLYMKEEKSGGIAGFVILLQWDNV